MVHHLFMYGHDFVNNTCSLIVSLIAVSRFFILLWNASTDVGSSTVGNPARLISSVFLNLSQSVSLKLYLLLWAILSGSISKMLRMGRWSIFCSLQCGNVSHDTNVSNNAAEQKMLLTLMKFFVVHASSVGISLGKTICISYVLIRSNNGCVASSAVTFRTTDPTPSPSPLKTLRRRIVDHHTLPVVRSLCLSRQFLYLRHPTICENTLTLSSALHLSTDSTQHMYTYSASQIMVMHGADTICSVSLPHIGNVMFLNPYG